MKFKKVPISSITPDPANPRKALQEGDAEYQNIEISESEIERRKKISAAFKGKPLPPEHRAKIGASNRGKHRSKELRDRISAALTGKHPSAETLIKLSNSRKGHPVSIETREKIRMGHLGKQLSVEHKKKLREARVGKYCGEKHPAWKGGVSFEPYCVKFNENLKERVRAFFRYRCVECEGTSTRERLLVHHVNFDKQTCCNSNIPLFVPLCRSCHSKTNFNRCYWENHFTNLINEKFGGKCYFTQEEMMHL